MEFFSGLKTSLGRLIGSVSKEDIKDFDANNDDVLEMDKDL
jgi:hypothetical protein